MREFIILFLHALTMVVRLVRAGGMRSVLAESILLKHQLLILNRSRRRAPNLRASDRLIAGLCTPFVTGRRLARAGIVAGYFRPRRRHDYEFAIHTLDF